jgi:uncharacterized CHY-type Zn-finger protein
MFNLNKLTTFFTASAGAILLAMASALFVINVTGPTDLITPHDPIFGLPIKAIYWTFVGLALAVALDILFGTKPFRPMLLLAWLTTNFLIYRIGLISFGSHGLTGFFGGFPYAFGMPARVANGLIQAIMGYLFIGSYGTLWSLARQQNEDKAPLPAELKTLLIQPRNEAIIRTLKISCTVCGGHIEFPTNSFGEKIPCPHCHTSITLQKARNLKILCPACAGRIEFPEYAIGETIPCPHCKTAITLKEPA